MTLPGNAYARDCARRSGKLLARAVGFSQRHGWDTWACGDKANALRDEALRWHRAPWCPVWLGEAYAEGALTLTALARAYLVPFVFLLGVATAVYLIMALGAWVL